MSTLDILRIPLIDGQRVTLRYSPLPRTGLFNPGSWDNAVLAEKSYGWWEIDLSTLSLADGNYEYEFVVEQNGQPPRTVSDPYAEEITRFGGYRGIFHIKNGHRFRPLFSWDDELTSGTRLPDNNEIVIYELPMRWVDTSADGEYRQVGLGTFDKAVFERMKYIHTELGVNAIELLPVQDSPDTLNWGYGTRFFFAPDLDMGGPFDLKLFIKGCHQKGIRVILDIVMNHARQCPLAGLAYDWFFEKEADNNRNAWGGELFTYNTPLQDGYYPARSFHHDMAEYWIKEYHVDGFRIDEFKGIENWDFISGFSRHAWEIQRKLFPDRPFVVIAEDSARRPEITMDINEQGKIVDSMWDFDYRDELRKVVGNRIHTSPGKPSRSQRVRAMISGSGMINGDDWRTMWNDRSKTREKALFTDLAQRITYCSSHDVQNYNEQRLYPFLMEELCNERGLDRTNLEICEAHNIALEQMSSTFAIMLTTVGVPMFLAGEEFADLHDINHSDWRLKMSDPIDWRRRFLPGRCNLFERVKQLIKLRTGSASLQRNEIEFFGLSGNNAGFVPSFDENDGERVFIYCRTGGKDLGAEGQILVVANCGPKSYPAFQIDWHWGANRLTEHAGVGQPMPSAIGYKATLELNAYQVRVFST